MLIHISGVVPTATCRYLGVPCAKTGSTNDAYSPAWFAPQSTPAAAADDLERAVLASVEGSDLLRQVTLASGAEYRAFSAPR
jgi:hypothetical protein